MELDQNSVLQKTEEDIAKWLKSTKFKKKAIGGVDEADVWKKINELNSLYEKAMLAQKAAYEEKLREKK